ncbi:MAG: hypothetical protein FWD55_07155, partial [Propionibacteriaceae bacterium]|nr:hypothetical protein [Propionibacteriaceae bacterium]
PTDSAVLGTHPVARAPEIGGAAAILAGLLATAETRRIRGIAADSVPRPRLGSWDPDTQVDLES